MSKLRENNKTVIGVGVKQSTSDLLISNCDEFIYYDDLVRNEKKRPARRRTTAAAPNAVAPVASEAGAEAIPTASEPPPTVAEIDRKQEALDIVMETVEALIAERGAEEKIWGSMVKQAIKRRQPGFNE